HGFKLGRNAHPWPYALVGVALVAAVVAWLRPAPVADDAIKNIAAGAQSMGAEADFDYKELQAVLQQRCVQCHGAQVQMKGLRLDVPEQLASRAPLIYQQVVQQKLMPLNNATQMTEAERALVARWFQAGAPVR
ncbi:MAG: urate hydroxylase PuuD, partial [Giesbergeria sp.]